ncbi:MAG TPA: Na/Pi symporter [Pseudolabrys sp.]|nr:Na/Pi symporter [Pseudolabrys sp.]
MQAIAPFLTGVGLFFCGVHLLSSHLVPLAGRRMRLLLTRIGGRPVLAALIGSFAGVVTQSTNAVTAVIIGLVSGGLVEKRRAIIIPTWSHVGTSVLVVLVAIDFRLAASYLVALAGMGVYFGLDRSDRARHIIGTLLGLGLLFIGMQSLKSGTEPLRDYVLQGGFMATAATHPIALFAIGVALSFICQSSSVAAALAVAATGAGFLDLTGAAWIVYGANLGSGANYILLARGHSGEAAQIALMQCMQKCAGFAVVVIVLAVGALMHANPIDDAATALARTTSGQLAWVFLLYQIAGSGLCTLLLGRILPILERLAPPSLLQELSRPVYLIEDALVEPSFALELVGREENRLLERLPTMLDDIRADAEGPATDRVTLRAASVSVIAAMAAYLGSILEAKLERTAREQAVRMQHRTANLAAMFEGLDEFAAACVAARQWPSSGRVADQMIESLHTLLSSLAEATASSDAGEREFMLTLLGHRDELMERIRQRVLREDPNMPPKAQDALFAATMLFERVIWLARRNALLLTPGRLAAGSGEQLALTS